MGRRVEPRRRKPHGGRRIEASRRRWIEGFRLRRRRISAIAQEGARRSAQGERDERHERQGAQKQGLLKITTMTMTMTMTTTTTTTTMTTGNPKEAPFSKKSRWMKTRKSIRKCKFCSIDSKFCYLYINPF